MKYRIALFIAVCWAFLAVESVSAQQTTYRIDVGTRTEGLDASKVGDKVDNVQSWEIVLDEGAAVPLLLDVVLETAMEACLADPSPCDGTENFKGVDEFGDALFGCSDEVDNNDNGLIDQDDPDCVGAQGWSFSLATDECFNIMRASTNGTAGDLDINPGGLRDVQGGNFEKTELGNPDNNGGQQGAVSAVVLSFTNPVILPQVGESVVCAIFGEMDASGLAPGGTVGPCTAGVIPGDETGLRGSGEPVQTAVTVGGSTDMPNLCDASIVVRIAGGPPPEICDNQIDDDEDGDVDCDDPDCDADPACVVPEEICDNGVDDDEDGDVDCDDADCDGDPACPLVEICDNEIDDDEDGDVDCDDADCVADPACVVPDEICDNEIDDDEDGDVDCDDADCVADPACVVPDEICDNEIDDDEDGDVDCDDADCAADPFCLPQPSEGQTTYSVAISDPPPTSGDKVAGVVPFDVEVGVPTDIVRVTAGVRLLNELEACLADPSPCDGSENFQGVDEFGDPLFGCSNEEDDNGNGLVDQEDPDCQGTQGWSLSVRTADCFNIVFATTRDTVGDLNTNPPGLRDIQGGNFEKTEVVDPARNGGQQGAVSAVVLSFTNPVILGQTSDVEVLRLLGDMDVSGLGMGDSTSPCAISVVPSTEEGLRGAGEPVQTAVTVSGDTDMPNICDATVTLTGAGDEPDAQFVRGNANDDSRVNIADPVWIISALFRDGPESPCEDMADANDDGMVDQTDALFLIMYQFDGGPRPSAPFPDCGTDPTADTLPCNPDLIKSCP